MTAHQQPPQGGEEQPYTPSLFDLHPELTPHSETSHAKEIRSELAQARVLSMPEPLASLALLGIKRIFTTGRFRTHRGITLIYTPGPARAHLMHLPKEAANALEGREMHRKAIIGYCRIHLVSPTEALRQDVPAHGLTDLERALDNYKRDRYAIYLEEPHWLKEPVPCNGRGQLWKPDQRTIAAVASQL